MTVAQRVRGFLKGLTLPEILIVVMLLAVIGGMAFCGANPAYAGKSCEKTTTTCNYCGGKVHGNAGAWFSIEAHDGRTYQFCSTELIEALAKAGIGGWVEKAEDEDFTIGYGSGSNWIITPTDATLNITGEGLLTYDNSITVQDGDGQ